jgi:glycosyltransferase involved in cell wall biosynthesis
MFKNDTKTTKNKRLLCERAVKIIAISENTKKDLVDIFNIDPSKIEVIYLGQSFNTQLSQTIDLPDRYILFTGQRWGYKNFTRFATAFAQIVEKEKRLKLICTGNPFTPDELLLFNRLRISKSVVHFFANDAQLVELYKKAQAFIFPSEYEGFGIPILEAFACGCPIALSNSSCFPEIAGDAGVYFDPTNIESMVDAIQQILNSNDLRKEIIKKGVLRLSNFSWKRMAKETCSLYRNLNL